MMQPPAGAVPPPMVQNQPPQQYGQGPPPPMDTEIRLKKDQCYTDIESGLWGWDCKSSMINKENCALKCLSPHCYELVYESDPLKEGENDLIQSQEYKYCMQSLSQKSTPVDQKKASKVNGGKASSLSQKSTPADQKKPNPNKMKTSYEKSESKDFPDVSPSQMIITAKDIHVSGIVADSEDIKELHITSSVETNMANETGCNEHSYIVHLPKPAINNEPSHCEVDGERVVEIYAAQPKMKADLVPELPTAPLKAIEENCGTNDVTPSYREISEIEESTPPTRELSADACICRKKWITAKDPPKAAHV